MVKGKKGKNSISLTEDRTKTINIDLEECTVICYCTERNNLSN